jgi:hypothetical protein
MATALQPSNHLCLILSDIIFELFRKDDESRHLPSLAPSKALENLTPKLFLPGPTTQ